MPLELGDALIVMSFINLFGFMIILSLRDRTWFKKQNWKAQNKAQNKILDIKLGSLRKELGMKSSKGKTSSNDSGGFGNVIADKIGEYLSNSEEGTGSIISDFLEENPDVIQSFFKGFLAKNKNEQDQDFWNN